MVVVEELQVKNMSKSAKKNEESPGKNVKAKSGLNRGILDQGWSLFSSMLDYKLEELGGHLVKVSPHHTSQICPCCEHQAKENRKSQSRFVCENCGHTANADDVGALNILARGYRVLACESRFVGIFDEAGTSRKQRYKPTRGIISHESHSFRCGRMSSSRKVRVHGVIHTDS